MNAFTEFLLQKTHLRKIAHFTQKWDLLEKMVIDLFREDLTPDSAVKEWGKTRKQLIRAYPALKKALAPHWPQARVGGKKTQTDPFETILAVSHPAQVPGNWPLMQTLPAAREAINRLILEHQKSGRMDEPG